MTRSLEDLYSRAVQDAESRHKKSLLLPTHSAAATARPTIAHAQLRHLLSCPQRRGVVYYVSDKSIVERDLLNPQAPPRIMMVLDFLPTCLATTTVTSGSSATYILFAAGGHNSNIHLSLHAFPSASAQPLHMDTPPRIVWTHVKYLSSQNEIVNYIFFTPATLTGDQRAGAISDADIRVVVSGNDMVVKFFDVVLPAHVRDDARLQPCGAVRLDTCVNHVSISPNGRTLLCVGDTPKAYLFHISPGTTLTFTPAATYTLPPPPPVPHAMPAFRSRACFATAWSADGLKFAVASQEGQLCVWDVRSAVPLYTFWTPFRRNSAAGRWDWEDLGTRGGVNMRVEDWANNGPDSGVRNVRFSAGEGGRELMVWAEHTTSLHVIDARTFDPATHSVIPFPDLSYLVPAPERAPSPPTVERAQTPGPAYARHILPPHVLEDRVLPFGSRVRIHATTPFPTRIRTPTPPPPLIARSRTPTPPLIAAPALMSDEETYGPHELRGEEPRARLLTPAEVATMVREREAELELERERWREEDSVTDDERQDLDLTAEGARMFFERERRGGATVAGWGPGVDAEHTLDEVEAERGLDEDGERWRRAGVYAVERGHAELDANGDASDEDAGAENQERTQDRDHGRSSGHGIDAEARETRPRATEQDDAYAATQHAQVENAGAAAERTHAQVEAEPRGIDAHVFAEAESIEASFNSVEGSGGSTDSHAAHTRTRVEEILHRMQHREDLAPIVAPNNQEPPSAVDEQDTARVMAARYAPRQRRNAMQHPAEPEPVHFQGGLMWAGTPIAARIDPHVLRMLTESTHTENATTPAPVNIAGICFDPSGGWLYVAGERGVVEWRVREREEGRGGWGCGAWV